MQTKKRAKPVKFEGKEKIKKEIPSKEIPEVKEEIEAAEIIETVEVHESEPISESDAIEKSLNLEHPDSGVKPNETAEIEPQTEPEEFFSLPPDKYEKKKSIIPYFLLVMFVTFLLGLTFFYGIYYAVSNNIGKNLPDLISKPTVIITKIPEKLIPTKKSIDLSAYSISVLNGTDIAGTAAKLKIQLVDAGFKVVTTGNADNTNYVKTEISAKKSVDKEYFEKLKDILKKSYQLGSTSTLTSGTADVIITIGSASAK